MSVSTLKSEYLNLEDIAKLLGDDATNLLDFNKPKMPPDFHRSLFHHF